MTRAAPYDRDKALDAALQLFWLKGYHATSVKDLEAALAMKPGSIYAAFKSKEALYLASLERYFERMRDTLRRTVADAASPLGALTEHLRRQGECGNGEADGLACMLVKTLLDTTAAEPVLAERTRTYLDLMRDEIAAGFQTAKDRGELPPEADVARLAHRYQAELSAVRIEVHRGADPVATKALADDLADAFLALRVDSARQNDRAGA